MIKVKATAKLVPKKAILDEVPDQTNPMVIRSSRAFDTPCYSMLPPRFILGNK